MMMMSTRAQRNGEKKTAKNVEQLKCGHINHQSNRNRTKMEWMETIYIYKNIFLFRLGSYVARMYIGKLHVSIFICLNRLNQSRGRHFKGQCDNETVPWTLLQRQLYLLSLPPSITRLYIYMWPYRFYWRIGFQQRMGYCHCCHRCCCCCYCFCCNFFTLIYYNFSRFMLRKVIMILGVCA